MKLLRKLFCAISGHETRVHQAFTPETRRIVCDRCGGDWAMNDRERIVVPWSGEFAQFYEGMGHTIRPHTAPTHPSATARNEKD